MKALPIAARVYIAGVVAVGALSLWVSQRLMLANTQTASWEVAVFVILGMLAGPKKVVLTRHFKNEEAGSMSLGFAITLASMVKCGPGAAVMVSIAACMASCLFPKRQPLHQLSFNLAVGCVDTLLGGLAYIYLRPEQINGHSWESFRAITAAALVFYAVNTFAVATVIGLCAGQTPWKVWREGFVWTAPSYLSTASITALAMILFDNSFFAVLVFVVPVAVVIYQSYVTYLSREKEKERHIEELQASRNNLADLYLATIKSLALAIDAKDQYTHQHIVRVQRYAVAIAMKLGLSGDELEAVKTGALLHDIGKLGVPEFVLMKPGRLTPEEYEKIKKHPEIGEAILDPVEFPWPVLPIVRHHHEKWDGTGYPDGLKGESIPLTARIMAVADVYDALTSSRSYRKAWSHERALATIQKDAGSHFDPVVVDAFVPVIDDILKEMKSHGEGPLVWAEAPEPAWVEPGREPAEQISRGSSELWSLYETAQSLSCGLGRQDTVEFLCRKLERIFPGSLCAFLVPADMPGALRVASAVGVDSAYFKGAQTLRPDSVSARVFHERETYAGEYDPDDILIVTQESQTWVPLQSAAILPVAYEGQSLGVLSCYLTQGPGLNPHEVQLLERIAARIAESLYNSALFERNDGDAVNDPLTGALNLRHVTSLIEDRCSTGEPFAILCLDLDNFKAINNNFGHEKGDDVLKEVAKVLVSAAGPDKILARHGGDKFLIILDGAGREQAHNLAGRLEDAIGDFDPGLYHTALGHLKLGISAGIACYPQDGRESAGLLGLADAEMDRVKIDRKLKTLAQGSAELKKAS